MTNDFSTRLVRSGSAPNYVNDIARQPYGSRLTPFRTSLLPIALSNSLLATSASVSSAMTNAQPQELGLLARLVLIGLVLDGWLVAPATICAGQPCRSGARLCSSRGGGRTDRRP
jgi:hypothetical protein